MTSKALLASLSGDPAADKVFTGGIYDSLAATLNRHGDNLLHFLNPEAIQNLDPVTDSGWQRRRFYDLASQGLCSWSSDRIVKKSGTTPFANRTCFDFQKPNGDMHLTAGTVRPAFTYITVISAAASAITAAGDGLNYLFSTYDPFSNRFGFLGSLVRTEGHLGYRFQRGGDGGGVFQDTVAESLISGVHVIAFEYLHDTGTASIYVDNAETPVLLKSGFTGSVVAGPTAQWWIGSNIGAADSGWIGQQFVTLIFDETDPVTRTTAQKRSEIFAALKAYSGI